MRPQSTYLTYTHTLPHAIPALGTISLVCLGQGQTYSKQVYPSLVLIYGTTYLRQSDLVSYSAPSRVNFVHTLKQLHRTNCDKNTARERDRERGREYGIRNTEILFNKAIAPFEGV